MSRVVAVCPVLPEHRYPQEVITEAFAEMCLPPGARQQLLRRLHTSARVGARHLALPLEEYARAADFGAFNDAFIEVGVELGARAVLGALRDAGLRPEDVDTVVSTTVTGFAIPSIEARIAQLIGLRPDVRRVPLMGLGCLGGAAGISRTHDLLLGRPHDVAVLLSVELCSLTFQKDDTSTANLVGSGLFGDGAAAVVMVGERRAAAMGLDAAPRVVGTRSRFYPDTDRVMGWDIGGSGFRLVLAATVADVVQKYLGNDVDGFLADHGLATADVDTWVAHPGGPKVIAAIVDALGLEPEALDVTRRSLAEIGNLSSSSVLHVLERTLAEGLPTPGTPGVLMAMGPGFCAELVLLRW